MSWTVQGVCYIACHACVSNIYCNEVTHRNLASAWPCISWCAVGWLCECKEGLGCLSVWHMKLGCGFVWPILVKAYTHTHTHIYIYIYRRCAIRICGLCWLGQTWRWHWHETSPPHGGAWTRIRVGQYILGCWVARQGLWRIRTCAISCAHMSTRWQQLGVTITKQFLPWQTLWKCWPRQHQHV